MSGLVGVADDMFGRQGFKVARGAGGDVKEVPPGQLLESGDVLLGRYGDPNFQIRLTREVHNDGDVPEDVAIALAKVSRRLSNVTRDGREAADGSATVEGIVGPVPNDGAMVIYVDSDGMGCTPPMIETMVGIFVEELTPLGVTTSISVASPSPEA